MTKLSINAVADQQQQDLLHSLNELKNQKIVSKPVTYREPKRIEVMPEIIVDARDDSREQEQGLAMLQHNRELSMYKKLAEE